MSDCTVYIDEAGDLGINRGTRWFVLTAVIVDKQDEPHIRARLDAVKTRLNVQNIHLRKIPDFYKRALIVHELNGENFTYANILVDTCKFDISKIPNTTVAYNYVCKYLLQRVSSYLTNQRKTCDVVLSARGTSRDGELITYIKDKLLPYPGNHIDASAFENITAKSAGSWDLLQLADICATTMFLTYEINGYGFTTPCYSAAMNDHLYRRNGTVDSFGVKFFTPDMKPDVAEIRKTRICAKKKEPPV